MNVLLVGSGGREHALAWKIAQSSKLSQLYTFPGNPGTAKLGTNIPGTLQDLSQIVETARDLEVELVVIGPEVPLAGGLADLLRAEGITVYGPSAEASQIEADKAFAKDFMKRHNIPTANYRNFKDFDQAYSYYRDISLLNDFLPVIKVSGLAAGKGVFLPKTIEEAEQSLRDIMLNNVFGEAGAEVVIEERLIGREVSILAFSDGKTVVPMPPAQDHKRLLDYDQGPNTGGMGVFAPAPFVQPEVVDWIVEFVIKPAVDGLRAEGRPFIGTIYAGMILTAEGPKTLEFNCRFGDPETQVILPLLESDLLDIFMACVNERLHEISDLIKWKDEACVCVVLASKGYPGKYQKGVPIAGLESLPYGVVPFHAGTATSNNDICTNGGRVLGITATAETITAARTLAYEGVNRVHFDGNQYRKDIAKGL